MKKNLRVLFSMVLVIVLSISIFAGCGKKTEGASSEANGIEMKAHKIGVALYTDAGKGVVAIKAFLEGIDDTLNVQFQYTTLSAFDEATNKTKIQELISAGCEGIITTVDMGTPAILEECKKANVYLAGYLCDFNNSFYTAHDAVFLNDHFLGAVADGLIDQSVYGEKVAQSVIDQGLKNVGIMIFPDFAFPNQTVVAKVFTDKINAHNATVSADQQIKVLEPSVLNFAPMETNYLTENPDMDAIFSVAAGAGLVYPTLVAANKTNIKLFTTGFEGTDDVDNFGTSGNSCYQSLMFSSPEAIVYPLVLMIDKLNGVSFSDQPTEIQRVDASPMMIMNDADMKKVKDGALYYTGDYNNAFIKADDIVKLCASYNKEATYVNLVKTVQSMGVDNIQ